MPKPQLGQDWGEYLKILRANDTQPDDEEAVTDDLVITRHAKKSRTTMPRHPVVIDYIRNGKHHPIITMFGDMHFQHLVNVPIRPPYKILDQQGCLVPADSRINLPGIFHIVDAETFPTLPCLIGTGPEQYGPPLPEVAILDADGLSDRTIHIAALSTLQAHSFDNITFWPPKHILAIQQVQTATAHAIIDESWPTQHTLCGIIWDEGHWVGFTANKHGNTLFVIVHDSLERNVAVQVDAFLHRVHTAKGCERIVIDQHTTVTQHHGAHCGTIALLNILQQLGIVNTFTERDAIQWYHQLRTIQQDFENLLDSDDSLTSTESFSLSGAGPTQLAALAQLLEEKGVPRTHANSRAQLVAAKLGWPYVEKAMQDRNPWAALKQGANKPGINLRLLTEEEQKAYIEMRAATKHGAQIRDYKQKKSSKPRADKNTQPLIRPEHLTIDETHFQDERKASVPQIAFHNVAAEQRGLALCSLEMAMPFLQNPKSISTNALGLLILDPPAEDLVTTSGATKLRFPAKCNQTDESLLLYGCLLNIGDIVIKRVHNGPTSKPDTIPTCIVKLQVFRDQFQENWQQFVQAPVRRIIQVVPALNLCHGQNCGTDCANVHAAIDQPLDTVVLEVWGRAFSALVGGKRSAEQSEIFTVCFRVPNLAIEQIARVIIPGVYVDPRQADIQKPHDNYEVIWLQKATADEAMHQCKTNPFALALARTRNRYGIRVLKVHAEKAWTLAKPGMDYHPVKIGLIYEVLPIPHGTQRKAIVQMLSDWGWCAKPLQPSRGTAQYMIWKVGAEDPPPSCSIQCFGTDVIANQIRSFTPSKQQEKHIAPQRTQLFYKQTAKQDEERDPWSNGGDPWAKYANQQASSSSTSQQAQPQGKHIDTITQVLKQDIAHQIKQHLSQQDDVQMTSEQDLKLQQLESTLVELQQQNSQFQTWFQEAGVQMKEQQQCMGQLRQELKQVQEAVPAQVQTAIQAVKSDLATELQKTFEAGIQSMGTRLEALLEKKQRHEWLSQTEGGCGPHRLSAKPVGSKYTWWPFWLLLFSLVGTGMCHMPNPASSSSAHWAAVEAATPPQQCGKLNKQFDQISSQATHAIWDTMQSPCHWKHFALQPRTLKNSRIGEADNPGPDGHSQATALITLGQSNPGGLRCKELHAAELGMGIWSYAETHLTPYTAHSFQKAL